MRSNKPKKPQRTSFSCELNLPVIKDEEPEETKETKLKNLITNQEFVKLVGNKKYRKHFFSKHGIKKEE